MCYKKHKSTLINLANNRCQCCGVPGELVELGLDHVIPRSENGGDDIENLQVLCGACNNIKSNWLIPKFGTFAPIDENLSVVELMDMVQARRSVVEKTVSEMRTALKAKSRALKIQWATALLASGKRSSTVRNIMRREGIGEARCSDILKSAKAMVR